VNGEEAERSGSHVDRVAAEEESSGGRRRRIAMSQSRRRSHYCVSVIPP